VASNGGLSSIGASPFADQQTAPCWVEITHNGRFLFAVNTASGSISRYRIAPAGGLRLLGSTPVTPSSSGPVDARLSDDGRNLYLNESGADSVGEFSVSRGNLTQLGTAALPAGASPAGMVVH
jgi:6-phosphogluconolactonase (cycloisomerase 2 family)